MPTAKWMLIIDLKKLGHGVFKELFIKDEV